LCRIERTVKGLNAVELGRILRHELGLHGRVDVEGVALGIRVRVDDWDLPVDEVHEVTAGRNIGVAAGLDDDHRRWAVAHGIGHCLMHEGVNDLWLRADSFLHDRHERQAEHFALGLLVDLDEALLAGMTGVREIARYFGVPLWVLSGRRRLL
jgi:hypothetical protein